MNKRSEAAAAEEEGGKIAKDTDFAAELEP
jgi:hypothetical protein